MTANLLEMTATTPPLLEEGNSLDGNSISELTPPEERENVYQKIAMIKSLTLEELEDINWVAEFEGYNREEHVILRDAVKDRMDWGEVLDREQLKKGLEYINELIGEDRKANHAEEIELKKFKGIQEFDLTEDIPNVKQDMRTIRITTILNKITNIEARLTKLMGLTDEEICVISGNPKEEIPLRLTPTERIIITSETFKLEVIGWKNAMVIEGYPKWAYNKLTLANKDATNIKKYREDIVRGIGRILKEINERIDIEEEGKYNVEESIIKKEKSTKVYQITIDTSRHPTPEEMKRDITKFEGKIEELLRTQYGSSLKASIIGIETGPKTGMLHAHGVLCYEHLGDIEFKNFKRKIDNINKKEPGWDLFIYFGAKGNENTVKRALQITTSDQAIEKIEYAKKQGLRIIGDYHGVMSFVTTRLPKRK